jgi:hypothetical protein
MALTDTETEIKTSGTLLEQIFKKEQPHFRKKKSIFTGK